MVIEKKKNYFKKSRKIYDGGNVQCKVGRQEKYSGAVGHNGKEVANKLARTNETINMSKRGREESRGKFRITLGLPVGALTNCADNTGAKNWYIIAVKGQLNRLPSASIDDVVLATVKKEKLELRKKVHLAVIVQQFKAFRRHRLLITLKIMLA